MSDYKMYKQCQLDPAFLWENTFYDSPQQFFVFCGDLTLQNLKGLAELANLTVSKTP